MASDGFHPPLEEYLEAIHELVEEGTPVIQARLAERVGHSAPTTSEMVKRLKTEGYIRLEGRAIELTDDGVDAAKKVVRKHRLAERLLTDIIGVPWHKAHNEACRWEHVISDEVEDLLVNLLHSPDTCPHGNPIPGLYARTTQLLSLAEADVQRSIAIERITELIEIDEASLEYLHLHDVRPGAKAIIRSKAPDGTISLEIGSRATGISTTLAASILVSYDEQ